MLARQMEVDWPGAQEGSRGVCDNNRKFACDASMLDLTNDQDSEHVDFDEGKVDMECSDQDVAPNTQIIREIIEKEYAKEDSEKVSDSQPDGDKSVCNDYIISNSRTDLLGDQSQKKLWLGRN